MRGRQARIALVVDHPQRDLEGAVLVAQELCARGARVFLVPMYSLSEVIALGVDAVLMNYVRPNNYRALRACADLGIQVVVLDTEGGVLRDMEKFADDLLSRSDVVSHYCFWGYRQASTVDGRIPEGWASVTGCPRFDFLSEAWRGSIAQVDDRYADCILVNTNFPVLQPRFQSRAREVRELVDIHGYDSSYVEEWVAQLEIALDASLEAVRALAVRFADRWIVLRPHPFEDPRTYVEQFADLSNVATIQEGSVFQWLRACSVLVHHNCTTAVEAFQIGREPLMIDWVDTPVLDQDVSRSVSRLVESPEVLGDYVEETLLGRPSEIPGSVREARHRVVEDWFRSNDGHAHRRVADVLEAVAEESCVRRRSGMALTTAVASLETSGGIGSALKQGFRWMAGSSVYNGLKHCIRRKAQNKHKGFGADDVPEILGRLLRSGAVKCRVSRTGFSDARARIRPRFESVRMERA